MFTSAERYLCVPYFIRTNVQQDIQRALKALCNTAKSEFMAAKYNCGNIWLFMFVQHFHCTLDVCYYYFSI